MRIILIFIGVLMLQIAQGQSDSIRNFIFGHSLINHETINFPTPSDELTIPHWIYLLADHSGQFYGANGQYGFLPQHDNLPPISQWGYDIVPSLWDSDYVDFGVANFNTILLTAGNFIQYQAPSAEYYTDPGVTPISATVTIFDWLVTQEDNMRVYIYENWPDMGSLIPDFPPSAVQMQQYNDYTNGDFHEWWIEYQDALVSQSAYDDVKMIPVGPILAGLYENTPVGDIPILELYEDNAPHGRATTYFLAGLITYMAFYEEKAPLDYNVPSIIREEVANNYENIVEYIWADLLKFNFDSGESRVFFDTDIINNQVIVAKENIEVFPNPTDGLIRLKGNTKAFDIEVIDAFANLYATYNETDQGLINITDLPAGMYFIRFTNKSNGQLSLQKIIKTH